jgi:hypothetical protein
MSSRGMTLGQYQYKGVIRYQGPEGDMQSQQFFTPTFTIAEAALVVSPTKMNVFYRGVPNPVEVSVPGVANNKLRVSISDGHSIKKQSDGTYKVFVEMERNRHIADNIYEVLDGVKKIAGLDNLKFRYYKNFTSKDATMENLDSFIPKDPNNYGLTRNQNTMENYKNFFSKGYIDSVDMLENTIICKKVYADPLAFEFVEFGDKKEVLENIDGKFDIMESYPEILFLTKYLGNYNISKYGNSLVFENEDKALVLKRIQK